MTAPSASERAGRERPPSSAGCGRGYEAWSKRDLCDRAKELGVARRHRMTKRQLIEALRGRRPPRPG